MTGWISLHRKIQDHEIFNEKRVYSRLEAWIYFLLNANHKEGKSVKNSNVIVVERGQLLTSKKKLRDIFGWSNTKLNKFLEVLELERMIHTKSTSKYTVITIENYDFYQSEEGRKHSNKTSKEHQKHIKNTSKTHQKHTNNNDNNELIINNNENKSVGVTSKNINSDYSEIIKEYNKLAFGLPTERTYEQINEWLKLHNKELIIHVMQYAHDLGRHNLSYVNGILRNAKQKQIETVADFEAENNRFTASKSNNSYANSLEARIAREQVKQKAERDKQNIKTVIDPNEELPF